MKLAAIDIGSNAIRLLISEVTEIENKLNFTKLNLVRIPLRLGMDVFNKKCISKEKKNDLIKAMKSFQLLMDVYKVEEYKAFATSAMRDAENGKEIRDQIRRECNIDVNIITGEQEAQIIAYSPIFEKLNKEKNYLYIDVGGGSTEVILFSKKEMIYKESFNIGTIRILNDQVSPEQWRYLEKSIKEQTNKFQLKIAIGSGGNINKLFSISKTKEGKPLNATLLSSYYNEMKHLSVPQRMVKYNLREDRADVVVPALQIFNSILEWADIKNILVPKIGLADSLIKIMYRERALMT